MAVSAAAVALVLTSVHPTGTAAAAPPPTTHLVVTGVGSEQARGVLAAVTGPSVVGHHLPTIGAVSIEVPAPAHAAIVEILEGLPGVEDVREDASFRAADAVTPTDPSYRDQWRHPATGTDRAWLAPIGAVGPTVAVLDSGVDANHPELVGRVLTGRNLVHPTRAATTDSNGHGTGVAGVIAARGNDGRGVAGSCWTCRILPVVVLDEEGYGRASGIAEGIRWAADQGAAIINLSLTGPPDALVTDAIRYAAGRGTLLVGAAGNLGDASAAFPASLPDVVAVEAVDHRGKLYPFSNRGRHVDLAAPGCDLTTWLAAGVQEMCGTSVAAPVVSGSAALALATRPSLRPADLAGVARATRRPSPGTTRGTLDALALVSAVAPCADRASTRLVGRFRDGPQRVAACFEPTDGGWLVASATPTARFESVARFRTRSGWQTHLVATTGGEGRDAVLSYHTGSGAWWRSSPRGGAFETELWTRFRTTDGWSEHLIADTEADGRAGVLSYHGGNGTWWRTREVAGAVETTRWTTYATRTGWERHLIADTDGDGHDELLSYHPGNGTWWRTADGRTERWATYRTTRGWAAHLVGDVTGDGKDDLLSYHTATGNWWLTSGGGQPTAFTTYATRTGWDGHRLADVDGDGRHELVSLHTASGATWVTDGATSTRWARSTAGSWRLVAVSDTDGDGRADLVIRDGAAIRNLRSEGDRFVKGP